MITGVQGYMGIQGYRVDIFSVDSLCVMVRVKAILRIPVKIHVDQG